VVAGSTPAGRAKFFTVVAVAQLVEPRVVISAVVGSSPIGHPISSSTIHS
jgi:hypothetical protein